MRTPIVSILISFAVFCCTARGATEVFTNMDTRKEALSVRPALDAERAAATAELQRKIPDVRIHLDEILASPKFIYSLQGFLTAPDNEEEVLPPQTIEMRIASLASQESGSTRSV